MAAYQYVTLVSSGGTPVRLANQRGAVLPTTGTGSLVFANGSVLNNPTINGLVLGSFGFLPGSLALPSIYFTYGTNVTTGIWSSVLGTINFAALGAPLGSATSPGDWTFVRDIAIGRNVTSGTWQGSPVGATYGGTGLSVYAIGDLLYASATNTLARQGIGTTGQVLSVVGGIPAWATLNTGVASFSAGTTGLTPATATLGAVTLGGTLAIANGGTGLVAYTTGDLIYASATNTLARQGIGTTGQILTVVGGIPTWTSIGAEGVASFSAGTTGLTPATSTMGAVTLAGTLAITNGGTGVVAFGAVTPKTANYQILAADSYKDFDNAAATGSVTFTLPTAVVGFAVGFAVMAAQTLEILAPSGVTIYLGELASSAGGNLQSNTVGSYVFLKCRSSTVWVAQASTGSWAPA